MSIEYIITEEENKLKISFSGNLDIYNTKELKVVLESLIEKSDYFIFDLKEVSEFHISALQLFITFKKYLKVKNKVLKIINHSFSVLQVFNLLGLISFFGDQIHISKDLASKLNFSYGTKKTYEPY